MGDGSPAGDRGGSIPDGDEKESVSCVVFDDETEGVDGGVISSRDVSDEASPSLFVNGEGAGLKSGAGGGSI